jgi:hypothetical protein
MAVVPSGKCSVLVKDQVVPLRWVVVPEEGL